MKIAVDLVGILVILGIWLGCVIGYRNGYATACQMCSDEVERVISKHVDSSESGC